MSIQNTRITEVDPTFSGAPISWLDDRPEFEGLYSSILGLHFEGLVLEPEEQITLQIQNELGVDVSVPLVSDEGLDIYTIEIDFMDPYAILYDENGSHVNFSGRDEELSELRNEPAEKFIASNVPGFINYDMQLFSDGEEFVSLSGIPIAFGYQGGELNHSRVEGGIEVSGSIHPIWGECEVSYRVDVGDELGIYRNTLSNVSEEFSFRVTWDDLQGIEQYDGKIEGIFFIRKNSWSDTTIDGVPIDDLITLSSEEIGSVIEKETVPTATPTPTPTGTPTPTPTLDISEGETTQVFINDRTYNIVESIPDTDKTAVTDTNGQLVSEEIAYDAYLVYLFSRQMPRWDYDSLLDTAIERRENAKWLSILNNAAKIGVGVLETYAMARVSPGDALFSAVDTILESINWAYDAIDEPYKDAFTEMAAAAATPEVLAEDIDSTTSISELPPSFQGVLDSLQVAAEDYHQNVPLAEAYSGFKRMERQSGTLASSKVDALTEVKGFLIGQSISLVSDEATGTFEKKARIAGLLYGYATIRMSVLQELVVYARQGRQRRITPTEVIQFYFKRAAEQHISAVAFAGASEYWRQLGDGASGIVWNAVENASKEAEWAARKSERHVQSTKLLYVALGGLLKDTEMSLENSLNATSGGVE